MSISKEAGCIKTRSTSASHSLKDWVIKPTIVTWPIWTLPTCDSESVKTNAISTILIEEMARAMKSNNY